MATKIIMPQGGQDLTEGTVLNWLKDEGESVRKDELICEVETEKAVFEVAAPCDGVLLKIIRPAGEIAKVFSAIGMIGKPGEEIEEDEIQGSNKEKEEKAEKKIDIVAIRKRLESSRKPENTRIKATGRAKKRAKERGVELSKIQGSGPGGRIVEQDVLNYPEQPETKPAPELPLDSISPQSEVRPASMPGFEGKREAMSKVRKVIARRLQQSKQTIPHFYVTVSVEMTGALKLREELNAQVEAGSTAKVSINDMVVKAAALALEACSEVNCILQDEDLVSLDKINIGLAVGLDEGLVVPVLPDVDILSLKGIAKKTKELVSAAKSGKQVGFARGAFTVSNMGMFDVENFAAIINPPESAILAVASVQKGVVVSEKNDLSIRDMMKLTISVDHRVIDGVAAAKFMNIIKYHLQNPGTLLS